MKTKLIHDVKNWQPKAPHDLQQILAQTETIKTMKYEIKTMWRRKEIPVKQIKEPAIEARITGKKSIT